MLQVQRPGDPLLGEAECVVVDPEPTPCAQKSNALQSQFSFVGSEVGVL